MRSITLMLSVLVMSAASVRAVEQENVAERLAEARALRAHGDAAAAATVLEALLDETPGHAAACLMLGEILADRGEWRKAEPLLRDLSGKTLGYPLHHVRGKVSLKLGRVEAARRDLEKALRYRPRSGADLFLLGEAHAGAGRWALAIDAYTRAQDCGRDDAALHLGLARAYFARQTCLGRVTTKKLARAEVGRIAGTFYVLEPDAARPGHYCVCPCASAVYQLAAARRLGAEGVSVDVFEADVWLAARRFDRARALYAAAERAIDGEPAASFYERYSRACLGLGDFDRHLRLLRKAVQLDPGAYTGELANAHVAASERAAAAGDLAGALYHLKEAVRAAPKSAEFHRRLADAFAEHGDTAQAEKHWREALQLRPDHPDRAEILRRLKRAAARTP